MKKYSNKFNIALLSLSLLTTIACKSSETPNKTTPLTEKEQAQAAELAMETEVGRQMAGRLLAGYSPNTNKQLNDYVATVGNYVVSQSEYAGQRFVFSVTKGSGVAAYSCPGGYVLISEGALIKAKNEAELAGILAHEIAHIGKKHMINTIKSRSNAQKNKSVQDLEASIRDRIAANSDSQSGATLARYLSGPNGATISVLMAVSAGITTLLEEGLDHSLEYEADAAGLEYVAKSGYDGNAFMAYLERLGKEQGSDAMFIVAKTHPSLRSRIDKLNTDYLQIKEKYPGNAVGQERFSKQIASLAKPKNAPLTK